MPAARTAFAALLLASTVATGCDALEREGIGPEGGVVVSEDGRMALEVPPGALDETVEISIEIHAAPNGAAGQLYAVEPFGLTFEAPAVLTYDFDDETLGGAEAEALTLVSQREASWSYLADQWVDTEDQTVSATVMSASSVTVVVE